jgi:hypothetical protein
LPTCCDIHTASIGGKRIANCRLSGGECCAGSGETMRTQHLPFVLLLSAALPAALALHACRRGSSRGVALLVV